MISSGTAAIVVSVMSHRLDALSRNPGNTSPGSGLSWVILLGLTIVSSSQSFLGRTDILGQAMVFFSLLPYTTIFDAINRWAPECAFPSRRDRRMRFSVRVHAQNALFRTARVAECAFP